MDTWRNPGLWRIDTVQDFKTYTLPQQYFSNHICSGGYHGIFLRFTKTDSGRTELERRRRIVLSVYIPTHPHDYWRKP